MRLIPTIPDEAFVFLARRAQRSRWRNVMNSRIYFDHSATTPVDPRVLDAMLPYLRGGFGNPSSLHREGRSARVAVENARAQVAQLIGADPEEIVFTASGSEADNLALIGAVRASGKPGHIVTSSIEHAAILQTCRFLATTGTRITCVPVDRHGIVSRSSLLRALQESVTLVSIMAANNVVGTLQPIEELAHLTKLHAVLFHTDAVQAAGKIPLDVNRLKIDLLSLSAHKLHGPKGVGALYVRRGTALSPIIFGGGQERGLRSATENVAGIVGFGAAAAIAKAELNEEAARLRGFRDYIAQELRQAFPDCYFYGHNELRLPGHLSIGFRSHETQVGRILTLLDRSGVAISAGSACSATHSNEPSTVLLAMGYDVEQARGLLRISLGRFNTREEIDRFLNVLRSCIRELSASGTTGDSRQLATA
jgi:cysteine desulfurase